MYPLSPSSPCPGSPTYPPLVTALDELVGQLAHTRNMNATLAVNVGDLPSMTEEMQSRKRVRGNEDGGDEPERHHNLWFEDGNIVLIAENVAFKAHRGVLARQSAVFHDMFCIPQPDVTESFDGCPVVHIQDAASDLAIFIEVLYDGFKYRRSNSWPVLQALLLLSHKYGAEDIRQEALFQLELVFPKSVEQWDERMSHKAKTGTIHTLYDPKKDCIAAVNTARTLELSRIQAAALYDCCQLDGKELVMGIVREDGRHDRLCEEDLIFCIRAVTCLGHINHYLMNKVGHAGSRRCLTGMSCETARVVFLSRINDPKEGAHYCILPNVLGRAEWLEGFLSELGACMSCIRTARRSQNEARRVFLERIDRLDFLADHMLP